MTHTSTEKERTEHIAYEAGVPLNFSMHRNGPVGAFTLAEFLKLIDSAVEYGDRRAPVVPSPHEPIDLTDTDVARIWRDHSGAARFDAHTREFAQRISDFRDDQWRLAAAPQPPEVECMTCNGYGAVGNPSNAEPCPDCTPRGHLAEAAPVQMPEPDVKLDGGAEHCY